MIQTKRRYQQEASKFIQATFVSFVQSILEEEIFTQLQGSGKTVSSLQVRSRVDNKFTCTRGGHEFILYEKNGLGECEKNNRSTLVLHEILEEIKKIASNLGDVGFISEILKGKVPVLGKLNNAEDFLFWKAELEKLLRDY